MLSVLDKRLRDLSSPDKTDPGTVDVALLEIEEAMTGLLWTSRRRRASVADMAVVVVLMVVWVTITAIVFCVL